MKEIIDTKNAPAAVGAYSQAVVVNGILFTSGQLPIDPGTGELVDSSVEEQARQSMENIGAILKEAGMSWDNVVKTTVFLDDIADFAKVNKVYKGYFRGDFPARSCFEVACLPKGARVEIEAIAAKV